VKELAADQGAEYSNPIRAMLRAEQVRCLASELPGALMAERQLAALLSPTLLCCRGMKRAFDVTPHV
jgi:hypothetical protein